MREAKGREGKGRQAEVGFGSENRCACARFLVLRLGFTYCDLAFGATLFDFNYGLYVDDICMNIHYVRSTLPLSQLQG